MCHQVQISRKQLEAFSRFLTDVHKYWHASNLLPCSRDKIQKTLKRPAFHVPHEHTISIVSVAF